MAVTLTCTPTSPRATVDACRIDVAGAVQNAGASNPANYPVQAEVRYYLSFRNNADVEVGRSYVFAVNHDGAHQFNDYVWPAAASSAKIALVNAATDVDVANTLDVVVQAAA